MIVGSCEMIYGGRGDDLQTMEDDDNKDNKKKATKRAKQNQV